jgi:RimJ/RimL family protein N-acetyltransferase
MMPPDLQPMLVGPRVIVRPIAPMDWREMFAAAADPEIWALHPISDRYTEKVFRGFFDGAIASGSAFSFVDRAQGKIIGSSRYHGYDPSTGEIEIGWTFLARAYWGGSYNLEIKRLMLLHAFKFADTVVFWVGETNWRSQRAMEKIGGARRPEPQSRSLGGKNHAHVVFEITKEDFRSSAIWR